MMLMQAQALARAVYARKELVILDDILSGLDAATEEEVFASILGPKGLLRQQGTTVILATNAGMYQAHNTKAVSDGCSASSL